MTITRASLKRKQRNAKPETPSSTAEVLVSGARPPLSQRPEGAWPSARHPCDRGELRAGTSRDLPSYQLMAPVADWLAAPASRRRLGSSAPSPLAGCPAARAVCRTVACGAAAYRFQVGTVGVWAGGEGSGMHLSGPGRAGGLWNKKGWRDFSVWDLGGRGGGCARSSGFLHAAGG